MKIYFLHNGLISFVKKDLEILQAEHEVRAELNFGRSLRNLGKNLHGVLWCDQVFCWFASIHFLPSVLLARIFRKKVVIVAGGFDVVSLPEIDYGNMRGGLKTTLVRLLLRHADRVISISKSNQREALENGKVDPDRSVMIYHGFAVPEAPDVEKEPMVVTIGEVTWSNLKRKGLEDFVRLGARFPEVPFKLIGKWSDDAHLHLKEIATPNVEIMGFVDAETFDDIVGRAKVYFQGSFHEGFGCSVAEAMLLKCVPVVSDVYALPEVVGDVGYLAPVGDLEVFHTALDQAFTSGPDSGDAARNRIIATFPLELRKQSLLEAVSSI
jgi:glycosyltransferase involved in cell wall biosynthesis